MKHLIERHLPVINQLVQLYKDELIEAHSTISNSVFCLENTDVSIIKGGLDYIAESISDTLIDEASGPDRCVKVRGVENYDSTLARLRDTIHTLAGGELVSGVTFHIFESNRGTESFPYHTDPADVILCMLGGQKDIHTKVDCVVVEETLLVGGCKYIPMNVVHRAINTHWSIMLSIGIEHYTIEHIKREG